MAKMNGCNEGMVAKSGKNSTRMEPASFARNNLAKGGVNKHMGGTDVAANPPLKPKAAAQGKHHHMPKGK